MTLQQDDLPAPAIGCGTPIGTPGNETTCGDHGICVKCWRLKHDQDPERLRFERAEYHRRWLEAQRKWPIAYDPEPFG